MRQIHVNMFELQAKFLLGFLSPTIFFILIGIKNNLFDSLQRQILNVAILFPNVLQ
jgi:hypothetical protein